MDKLVACGLFVRRQTKESGYSHYEGSWEELENITTNTLRYLPFYVKPGYRDGVVIVDLPSINFRTAIVNLTEDSK